jgi:hypothetical protein
MSLLADIYEEADHSKYLDSEQYLTYFFELFREENPNANGDDFKHWVIKYQLRSEELVCARFAIEEQPYKYQQVPTELIEALNYLLQKELVS